MRLRLVSFNIHHGEGAGGDHSLEAQARLLRELEADIAFLQEVDSGTARSGRLDQAAFLAERSGLPFHVFGKNMDMDGGDYGNAILSRFELTWGAHYVIPAHEPYLPRLFERTGEYYLPEPRGLLRAETRIGGASCTLLNGHFGFLKSELTEGVDAVLALLKRMDRPVLFGADMNTLDSNAPELVRLSESMIDCAAAMNQQAVATYPSDDPVERLDYLLARGTFSVVRFDVVPTRTSDHRPVVADIETEVDSPSG